MTDSYIKEEDGIRIDVRTIEERPLCPAVDGCPVCDWLAGRGPQPRVGDRVGLHHGVRS